MADLFDIDVLAYEPSPIGMICLRTRPHPSEAGARITEITLDHEFLMSSLVTASERALASGALALHPGEGLRVLVGGLGLGYTAREALASGRVARVRVIEYLPQVIGWMERGLVPLADELNDDPRLEVVEGDAYGLLAGPASEVFDLILVDVDHSPDEWLGDESQGFYGPDGLRAAARHLAPGGVLGVWSYAPAPAFEDALRAAFDEVVVEEVHFENPIVDEPETNWLFFGRCGPASDRVPER